MDMDKTEKNQEKFTCGEFEYQVIRSARKTMTLEVRRDGNVIVRAPLRTGLPRIKRFVNQKQEWVHVPLHNPALPEVPVSVSS